MARPLQEPPGPLGTRFGARFWAPMRKCRAKGGCVALPHISRQGCDLKKMRFSLSGKYAGSGDRGTAGGGARPWPLTCEAAGCAGFSGTCASPWRRGASGEPPARPPGGSLCRPVGRQNTRFIDIESGHNPHPPIPAGQVTKWGPVGRQRLVSRGWGGLKLSGAHIPPRRREPQLSLPPATRSVPGRLPGD